ncbi:hypothetical protein L7F22_021704 [Adiantum nelumboides]|nr:hypothetical protein [Adiantum nelumboides]
MVITTYEGQHNHHSPALLRGSAELMLAAAGDGSSHHNLFLNSMQQVALADHHNINPQAPHIMNTPSSPSSAMVPRILDSGEHNVNHDNPYHRPQQAAPFAGFPSLSALPSLSNFTSYNRASNLSNFLPSNRGKTSSDLSMRQENNMHKLSALSSRAAPRAPTLVWAPGPVSSRAESYQTAQDSHTSSDHQGLLEDMVSF